MELKKQISLIRKTGHVHRTWYQTTYPDVARLDMEPAEHYLKYGARMGRNPGKNFDTQFYLDRYPDVVEAGLNPLLHYALYGKKENRQTGGNPEEQEVDRLSRHLWGGGDPDAIMPELDRIANNPAYGEKSRFDARHRQAIYLAHQGETARACALAETLPEIAPGLSHEKSYLVVQAFLHISNGTPEAAQHCLEQYLATWGGQDDADALLTMTNCVDEAGRLALFNTVYANAGLAPIRLRNPAQPLGMNNIEGDTPPPCPEDYGRVSVIMPVYEAEDTVETAIRSLTRQSYRNLEIIAVDDCSSDRTLAILERLAAEDARIRIVRQPQNAGAYPARNRGLELATGDFITTHDADDWSHPQKIERQLSALLNGKAQGIVGHWVRVNPSLTATSNWRISSEVLHWSHSTFLCRRALFDELGHWDNVRISADTELIWRMQAKYGFHTLHKVMPLAPLALALVDDTSLTRTKQTHVSTVYYGLRRFYREIAQHWHRQPGGLTPEGHAKRLAMIPAEMRAKPEGPVHLDLVLRGDLSNPASVARMTTIVTAPDRAGQMIGLDHVPDITRNPGQFATTLYDLLARPNLRPVIPGTEIVAAQELNVDD